MAARRFNLANVAIELAFVAIAAALGASGAPIWTIAALTLGMIGYWFWSRRRSLGEMRRQRPSALLGAGAISLLLVGAVLSGAFFAARALSGWMTA